MNLKNNTIIGMIHLSSLLGYKSHQGLNHVIKKALIDLKSLVSGGVDAVLMENEEDKPHQVLAVPEIIASMTRVVSKVVLNSTIPVGVEVLLNDPKTSLAIAKVSGAEFIRTDYFVDRMSREEYGGEMYINPIELMKYRQKINASNILVLTDIQVKYAKLLEKNKPITTSAIQAISSGSDGIIVTGSKSGNEPNTKDLKEVKREVGSFPVFIGSGFSVINASRLLKHSDGAIVGTSIKTGKRIDKKKLKDLMRVVRINTT